MNEQLQLQLQNALNRIDLLEKRLTYGSSDYAFQEFIREIAIPDVDNSTVTTQTITIGAGGGSATVPKNPNNYLRVVFRGKTYNIPAFTIS